jgi:hypothetical protein
MRPSSEAKRHEDIPDILAVAQGLTERQIASPVALTWVWGGDRVLL